MISSNLIFSFLNFMFYSVFLTILLNSGILFSTVVRAVVVYKLTLLGISFLTSFILALRVALSR